MSKQFLIQDQSPQTQHKIQQSLNIWSSSTKNQLKNLLQHQLPTEECQYQNSDSNSNNTKIMLQIINNLNINQYVQSFNSNRINEKKDDIVLEVMKEKMLTFFTEYEKMCREFVENVEFEVVGGKRDRGDRRDDGGEVQAMFQYLLDANQLMTSSEIKQFKQYLQQYPLSKNLITHTLQSTRTSLRDELLLLFHHITSTISQHLPSLSPSPSPSPSTNSQIQLQKCEHLNTINSISIIVWEDITKSNKFYELIFKEYIEDNNLEQFFVLLQQLIEKWVTLFVDLESGCWQEYLDGEEQWVPVIRKEGGNGRTWDEEREELRQPGCRKIRSQLL